MRIFLYLTICISATILPTLACQAQSTASDFLIDDTNTRRDERKIADFPVEAFQAIREFRNSLKAQKWSKGLSWCSKRVQDAAKQEPSAEAFFRKWVPVNELISTEKLRMIDIISEQKKVRRVQLLVPISKDGKEQGQSWDFWIEEDKGQWLIDFSTKTEKKN